MNASMTPATLQGCYLPGMPHPRRFLLSAPCLLLLASCSPRITAIHGGGNTLVAKVSASPGQAIEYSLRNCDGRVLSTTNASARSDVLKFSLERYGAHQECMYITSGEKPVRVQGLEGGYYFENAYLRQRRSLETELQAANSRWQGLNRDLRLKVESEMRMRKALQDGYSYDKASRTCMQPDRKKILTQPENSCSPEIAAEAANSYCMSLFFFEKGCKAAGSLAAKSLDVNSAAYFASAGCDLALAIRKNGKVESQDVYNAVGSAAVDWLVDQCLKSEDDLLVFAGVAATLFGWYKDYQNLQSCQANVRYSCSEAYSRWNVWAEKYRSDPGSLKRECESYLADLGKNQEAVALLKTEIGRSRAEVERIQGRLAAIDTSAGVAYTRGYKLDRRPLAGTPTPGWDNAFLISAGAGTGFTFAITRNQGASWISGYTDLEAYPLHAKASLLLLKRPSLSLVGTYDRLGRYTYYYPENSDYHAKAALSYEYFGLGIGLRQPRIKKNGVVYVEAGLMMGDTRIVSDNGQPTKYDNEDYKPYLEIGQEVGKLVRGQIHVRYTHEGLKEGNLPDTPIGNISLGLTLLLGR